MEMGWDWMSDTMHEIVNDIQTNNIINIAPEHKLHNTLY